MDFCKMLSFSRLVKAGRLAQFKNWRMYSKCKSSGSSKPCQILNEYMCGEKPVVPYVPKPKVHGPPFVSMWTTPDCEHEGCVLDLRYDMKYYSISDKRKRKYQVTWNECPRLLVRPRKVCIYEGKKRAKFERRPRKPVSEGKSPLGTAKKSGSKAAKSCVYVVNPCCKVGRRPASCKTLRVPADCQKRRAPYPSFSECKKDAFIPLPPQECACLDIPALCDAWAILRHRVAKGLPPTLCG